ncbi:hypothetical protein COB87_001130 [Candidatus Wolfebacteria bacterium]|nr:hypothetical protein [Candidatus Wolfebacteria bacterium]
MQNEIKNCREVYPSLKKGFFNLVKILEEAKADLVLDDECKFIIKKTKERIAEADVSFGVSSESLGYHLFPIKFEMIQQNISFLSNRIHSNASFGKLMLESLEKD